MTDFNDSIELELLGIPGNEWFVYHCISSEFPWLNKVGYGQFARVRQWERRGWVVQSSLLVRELTDATHIEGLLMDYCHVRQRSPRLEELLRVARHFGPSNGYSEMFDSPYLLGKPDGMVTEEQHVTAIAACLFQFTREFFVG